MNTEQKDFLSLKLLALTALFMALNVVFSSFSVPVPGGHLYLNDIVICTAALILNPVMSFCVGGIGAFLGDLFFYPAPMFVSLVTHGLQAVAISLIAQKTLKNKQKLASIIGLVVGIIIMVGGYTLGRAYIYSTPEHAMLKLPFQFLQAFTGAIAGFIIVWYCGLKKVYERFRQSF